MSDANLQAAGLQRQQPNGMAVAYVTRIDVIDGGNNDVVHVAISGVQGHQLEHPVLKGNKQSRICNYVLITNTVGPLPRDPARRAVPDTSPHPLA